ncbi:MAG: HD domain-containing protein [Alphaproteobacteria bacterium]|nr:HD domain-containing protein [Alphaproteobacteria bacterium]
MDRQQILNLAEVLGDMKTLKRTGWKNRCVPNPESDAEHSYSLAMLVLLLAPPHLDLLKALKLALVHDLPEVLCGDHVPGELSMETKAEREDEAMRRIAALVGENELHELFTEFELHRSPEAEFVWVLDRLDNVFTAHYYDQRLDKGLSTEFAKSARERIGVLHDNDARETLSAAVEALCRK